MTSFRQLRISLLRLTAAAVTAADLADWEVVEEEANPNPLVAKDLATTLSSRQVE